ncbi:hypothetical protein B9Z19DRAFT_1085899 [Tuber borchii]|uniref:Uncharacterized protein n=1 Tax=Tuber borchii TaxID=42251 RepID=A0A2T6ZQ85_TUBBO|nr:hypothetical protein B9Z19DRAFT_1085899 [Tuber borchii]
MFLLLRQMDLDLSWPSSRHISAEAKFSGRLPRTCFPAPPVASCSAGGNFLRCRVCESGFCGKYTIPPLPRSVVGALDHGLAGVALLPWNKYMAICLHPLSGDFIWAVSLRTYFIVPNRLSGRLVIFRTNACYPLQECTLPMLIPRGLVVRARQ